MKPFFHPCLLLLLATPLACLTGIEALTARDSAAPPDGDEQAPGDGLDGAPGSNRVAEVALGSQHACARMTDGTVRCWGDNQFGQLGDGTTASRAAPRTVPGLTGVRRIAAGHYHNCATVAGDKLRCWGLNSHGQLGSGNLENAPSPVSPGLFGVAEVALGFRHSCALLGDGRVTCWGGNHPRAQLGNGMAFDRAVAVPSAPTLLGGVQIAAGRDFTCALLADGRVSCWGWNASGQMGDGTVGDAKMAPTFVSGISDALRVAGGGGHACALLADRTLRCWGDNGWGQSGDGSVGGPRLVPVVAAGLSGVVEIATGGRHSCARLADGTVRCWGDNEWGQVGDGTIAEVRAPVPVDGLSGVAQVVLGWGSTCALIDGVLRCWGQNDHAQLGDGSTSTRASPVPVKWEVGEPVTFPAPESPCGGDGSAAWDGGAVTLCLEPVAFGAASGDACGVGRHWCTTPDLILDFDPPSPPLPPAACVWVNCDNDPWRFCSKNISCYPSSGCSGLPDRAQSCPGGLAVTRQGAPPAGLKGCRVGGMAAGSCRATLNGLCGADDTRCYVPCCE